LAAGALGLALFSAADSGAALRRLKRMATARIGRTAFMGSPAGSLFSRLCFTVRS